MVDVEFLLGWAGREARETAVYLMNDDLEVDDVNA